MALNDRLKNDASPDREGWAWDSWRDQQDVFPPMPQIGSAEFETWRKKCIEKDEAEDRPWLDLRRVASDLASQGIRTYPVGLDKTPFIQWGSPRYANRVPTEAELREWYCRGNWEKGTSTAVAMVNGTTHGEKPFFITTLDVDYKNGRKMGRSSYWKMLDAFHPASPFRQVTPTGGLHEVFRSSRALPVVKNIPGYPDIEIRGGESTIVFGEVYDFKRKEGGSYEEIVLPHPSELPLYDFDDLLQCGGTRARPKGKASTKRALADDLTKDLFACWERLGITLVPGTDGKYKCPWHDDEVPSLNICAVTGLFFCWSCHHSGSYHSLKKELREQNSHLGTLNVGDSPREGKDDRGISDISDPQPSLTDWAPPRIDANDCPNRWFVFGAAERTGRRFPNPCERYDCEHCGPYLRSYEFDWKWRWIMTWERRLVKVVPEESFEAFTTRMGRAGIADYASVSIGMARYVVNPFEGDPLTVSTFRELVESAFLRRRRYQNALTTSRSWSHWIGPAKRAYEQQRELELESAQEAAESAGVDWEEFSFHKVSDKGALEAEHDKQHAEDRELEEHRFNTPQYATEEWLLWAYPAGINVEKLRVKLGFCLPSSEPSQERLKEIAARINNAESSFCSFVAAHKLGVSAVPRSGTSWLSASRTRPAGRSPPSCSPSRPAA
jgi:hypothetical protein